MIKLEYKHIHGQMHGPDKTIVIYPEENSDDSINQWPEIDSNYYCTMVYAEGKWEIRAIADIFSNLPMISNLPMSDGPGCKCVWRGEFARFIDENIQLFINEE